MFRTHSESRWFTDLDQLKSICWCISCPSLFTFHCYYFRHCIMIINVQFTVFTGYILLAFSRILRLFSMPERQHWLVKVSLLLTLNIFHSLFFFFDFKWGNVSRALLSSSYKTYYLSLSIEFLYFFQCLVTTHLIHRAK